MIPEIHSFKTQERILLALLKHVPYYGWTFKALEQAVIDCGFNINDSHRVFSGNLMMALDFFMTWINKQTEQQIIENPYHHTKIRDKITYAINVRLMLLEPYKEAYHRTLRLLAHPQHIRRNLKYLYQTVDNIWYAIGDESKDFNFYTKRATLAAVYSSTVMKWLNDNSADKIITQQFLQKRLDNVMLIPKIKSRLKNMLNFS